MLIRDTIDPTRSMADGQIYTSKAALRAGYRAKGMIEVGNEPMARTAPATQEITRDDIERAYSQVAQGYKPAISHETTTVTETGAFWSDPTA